MGDGAGGLSDVLRRMAEGKHGRKRPQSERPQDREQSEAPPAARPVSRQPSEPREAPRVKRPAAPAATPITKSASPAAAPQPRATPAARRPPAQQGHDGLKAAAIPICVTTAVLLLIPSGWALLVLAGIDVWRSDWPSARSMALAMLACLPLALALIGGAGFLRWQLKQTQPSTPASRRK